MDGQTEETDHHRGCGNTDNNKETALPPTLSKSGKTHTHTHYLAEGNSPGLIPGRNRDHL